LLPRGPCQYFNRLLGFRLGLTLEDGALAVPPGPGLGVELDHAARDRMHQQYLDSGLKFRDDEIEIQTTVRVEGPLRLLWVKLVADGVAGKLAAQTEELISRARAA